MRIGEAKCSKCDTMNKLIKGLCVFHYQQKNHKRYKKVKIEKPTIIVKKRTKTLKGYALLIDGKLDINYDIYTTLELAKANNTSYRNGTKSKTKIVPCVITYEKSPS